MRMYLSSWRTGDHPEQLLALLDGPGTHQVAVIANAVDALPTAERRAAVEREIAALAALGLRPVELDLRDYFDGAPEGVAAALERFPAVWVRGGNVFVLRHALARSGADRALSELLRRDAVVYAGYSAGVCVLAPDLHGLDRCDDPNAVALAYEAPARFDGLALLDYVVVPHIDSPGHPENEILTTVADHYRAQGTAHRTLRDGQAIVINGEDTRVH
ncbi:MULTISPECIES: Type 1 glutamine amidotransferase-like domain-containing protein [Streptomyces]|uniref:Peptidase n=1 Tax=Streptomyces venezuelae TaxID=54571 RepID=A0A5P2B3A2_STRVZ|nr:Type 1 glutamine amidotransferase-like domain-containing protein [Streptomyces venezuelae]QES24218.1 peptidase [Streptomyces venezuelae]